MLLQRLQQLQVPAVVWEHGQLLWQPQHRRQQPHPQPLLVVPEPLFDVLPETVPPELPQLQVQLQGVAALELELPLTLPFVWQQGLQQRFATKLGKMSPPYTPQELHMVHTSI